MAGDYYIELRDFVTGARSAIITGAIGSGDAGGNGFTSLACRRLVNAPGLLTFTVPERFPGVATLPDKTQVVLWRRDAARGIDWYREFVAILRDPTYTKRNGQGNWQFSCPGLMSLLSWYHVLWPAAMTNRTAFTAAKAETIMKTLATYNAVAGVATAAAGRDRDAPNYGISVQADGAGGATINWTAGRSKTLLEELQSIALIAGGDFDLVYVSGTSREFRWYSGQRGSDKSATLTFAENLGNMDNIQFKRVRSTERTVAVVGGQGTEGARDTVVRTGTNYSSTNDIEVFIDARDVEKGATVQLQSRGDKRLDEMESRDTWSFDVIQTDGTYYGPSGGGSYTLGDLVRAVRPDGVAVTQQIAEVALDWKGDGQEEIGIVMRTK